MGALDVDDFEADGMLDARLPADVGGTRFEEGARIEAFAEIVEVGAMRKKRVDSTIEEPRHVHRMREVWRRIDAYHSHAVPGLESLV